MSEVATFATAVITLMALVGASGLIIYLLLLFRKEQNRYCELIAELRIARCEVECDLENRTMKLNLAWNHLTPAQQMQVQIDMGAPKHLLTINDTTEGTGGEVVIDLDKPTIRPVKEELRGCSYCSAGPGVECDDFCGWPTLAAGRIAMVVK